jgi:thiol-disulfide isomerase/thioredoxin
MRLVFRRVALAIACAVFFPGLAFGQEEQIGLARGAAPPASIMVENLDGQAVDLGHYVGKKPVIIEFWATWCPLCRALLPKIAAAHKKYSEKVDFLVVAVAVNETPRSVKRHLDQEPMPFQFFWDGKGAAVRAFEAPSTSYIVGLNAKGKVAYTGLGDKQDIEGAVKQVL